MKCIITFALCLLASLVAVGTASAQDHAVSANIPFGFYAGDKFIPAGTYTWTGNAFDPIFIAIRGNDSLTSVLIQGHADGYESRPNSLGFRKYGDQYFLHEIHSTSGGMNLSFPVSDKEKKANEKQVQIEHASVAPTAVYLALK